MKRLITVVFSILVLALLVQWLVIKYIPNVVYKIAVHRSGNDFNRWINAGKTDAGMRRVVLPNPDFIYSALFYDVSGKDIILTGNFPDSTYASVAFYDNRCQPYYVYNNLSDNRKGQFRFQLSKKSANGPNQLQAKTGRGVVICRFLVKDSSKYEKMRAYQQQLACSE